MASAEPAFEPKLDVERKSRPHPAEMACGGFFYLLFLVQIILAIVVLSTQNTSVPTLESQPVTMTRYEYNYQTGGYDEVPYQGTDIVATCPDGMILAWDCCNSHVYTTSDCVSEDLCAEMRACSGSCSARRLEDANSTAAARHADLRKLSEETGPASSARLHMRRAAGRILSSSTPVPENVWAFFEEHFYVPTVLFLSLFCAAFLWLVLLLKAATPVIWGTILLDIVLLVAVFIYFLVEFEEVCYPALIFAIVGSVAAVVLHKKIKLAGKILSEAMNALRANKRLFLVAFGVKIAWGGFFGFWIASMIAMFFNQKVVPAGETTECALAQGHPTGIYYTLWLVMYYWAMFFFQNVNLCVMTVQVSGWYFNQEGSKDFWVKGLQWSLTSLAGGNAICSAILGATSYLKKLVSDKIRFCVAIVNPVEWIPLCLACALKQCISTYTKFGMIGQAFGGGDFCSNAQKTFKLLKERLGEAVLTDFLGARVMAWATYVLCVGVMFAAFAWSESLHNMSIIGEIGLWGNFFLMLFMAGWISNPFASLVLVVVLENTLGSAIATSNETRAVFNIIFAALFVGAIAMFIMKFVSLIVTNAMNIIFFCYAVEADNGQSQERLNQLYDVIKKSVVDGVAPANAGVVSGSSPATVMLQVTVPEDAQPGQLIQVQGPAGPVQVTIPQGFAPGQIMQVAVPAAQQPAAAPAPAAEPSVAVVGNPMQQQQNNESNV